MTYPALPGLTPDGQLYQNLEMDTVEAVIPPGVHATCHSPATLELPNGDLLCCWFAGTARRNVWPRRRKKPQLWRLCSRLFRKSMPTLWIFIPSAVWNCAKMFVVLPRITRKLPL